MAELISIQKEDFIAGELLSQLVTSSCGCIVSFIGTVRDTAKGKEISHMEIEVYEEMAVKQLEHIRNEAIEKYRVEGIIIVHRYGDLKISDNIVFIGVSAGHRSEAFEACRYIIEELKVRVPLWKKEYTPYGEIWVEGDRHE